jgi:hypothetical protein
MIALDACIVYVTLSLFFTRTGSMPLPEELEADSMNWDESDLAFLDEVDWKVPDDSQETGSRGSLFLDEVINIGPSKDLPRSHCNFTVLR